MKIINRIDNDNKIPFSSSDEGDVFLYESKLYLKLRNTGSVNACSLTENVVSYFLDSFLVERVNAELTISNYI